MWALARSCEGRLREFRDQNCVQVSNFGVISICGASLEFCGENFFWVLVGGFGGCEFLCCEVGFASSISWKGAADLTLGLAIEITSDLRNETSHTFCIDWTAFKFPTTIKLREKHPQGC